MKHLFCLTLAFGLSVPLFAQKNLHVAFGCAFKTSTEDTDLYTFEPSAEADRIVSEICNAMGVSQNFDVRSSNVENALATNDGPRRIILYSTVFLKKFNEDARTRWAAYSVLAHEIGHHFNGHDFSESNPGRRKQMELEADRFSGSALRLLGANLDESKAGIETFALQGEQVKHPSAKARTEALANGWNQMQERLEKMGAGIPNSDSNIPRERDTDGDGIADKNDACPEAYGRPLTAGCPDADEDGITDTEDKCRYLKGPARWNGCPDSDGDGIPDHEDRCPKEPGYLTDGGCPPPDRDGDSVNDRADKCPDAYGLPRFQGCPDSDGDGVPDIEDKCPKEKGDPVYDGCLKAASVVSPTASPILTSNLLFPLYGVTLGKTTLEELKRLGVRTPTMNGNEPYLCYVIEGLDFWYNKDIVDHIYITHSEKMPDKWQSIGFNWQNSYNAWMNLFEKLGCQVSITKSPEVVFYDGHDSFRAEVIARYSSGGINYRIELGFNYSNGISTEDKSTLYCLYVSAK